MPYSKNQWEDFDTSKPLSAVRLNRTETQYEQAMADVRAAAADPESLIGGAVVSTVAAGLQAPGNPLGSAMVTGMTEAMDDPESPFTTQLNATIGVETSALVPPLVVQAIADDPTIASATAAAVGTAVTELGTSIADGLWLPASAFQKVAGSPTLDTANSYGIPMWLLQPSLTEVISAPVNFPSNLPDTVDIDILWTNTTAVAGTVQINARLSSPLVPGSSLDSLTEDNRTFTYTAPGQRNMRSLTAFKAVDARGGARRLSIRTAGGSLGANDIAILGVYVRRSARLSKLRISDALLPSKLAGLAGYNGAPFGRDNVVTAGNDQYAVYIDAAKKPTIVKRTRSGGVWGAFTSFDLSTIPGNPLGSPVSEDGHKNYVLGVDAGGYVHVSGGHHDTPLQIVRSTAPGSITSWAVPDLSGIPVVNRNSITYPQFFNGPGDTFYLWLRQGGSGNGAMFLNEWDGSKWNHVSRPLSGFVVDGADVDQSPYVHMPVLDASGAWHLFYMWRATDDLASTHDFGYIKSADGVNWTTAAGVALPATTLPQHTAPLIFTGNISQINQCGADVDDAGRPHSVMWVRTSATSGPSILRHYWWDGTTWHQDDELVSAGANPTFRSRPSVLAYGGKIFAMYGDWPVVGIAGATTPRAFTRWWLHDVTVGDAGRLRPFILFEQNQGQLELPFDHRGLSERGVIATMPSYGLDGNPNTSGEDGWIREIDLASIIANPPA